MVDVFSAFETVAKRRGDHTAIVYLGTKYSYNKLKDMSEAFASSLLDIGVKPGERVILYIPHGIQWVVAWLGVQKIGGVCVPITPIYTNYDLKHIANDCGAETVVCADTNFGYVIKAIPECDLKRVVFTMMADVLPWWKRWFGFVFDVLPKGTVAFNRDTYSFRQLVSKSASPDKLPGPRQNGRSIIEILYTGGTTKSPKGVPFCGDLFLTQIYDVMRVFEPLFPPETNVIVNGVPLFHILGQNIGLAALFVGATVILHPRVNLDIIFRSIQEFRAKTSVGVPALYRMMLEHDRLGQYDLSSVECWLSAGDVLPVEVGKRWREYFGTSITQAYGATETCGGVCICPLGKENPPQSVGKVLSTKKVQLVEASSLKPVEVGDPGELLVSSDYMVESYLNKPEETKQSFVEWDGEKWYRTGDIMSMDKDGHLYFVDRTVDMIKHKGYRIASSEIESLLQEHPAVMGSCVVGVEDLKVGERIKAFVVLKEDVKGITAYELIKWCRERLASYKIPQYIEFRDTLPKSKVGKLLRREIRIEEVRRHTAPPG